MGLFSMKSLALKWSFLFFLAGEIVFIEYFNLYMKQLGLSTSQIGFTTLFGLLQLSAPMCAFLGDRFRARKLIFAATTAVLFLTTLGPLLPIVVSLPTCFGKKNESSINKLAIFQRIIIYKALSTRPVACLLMDQEVHSFFQATKHQRSTLTKFSRPWKMKGGATIMYLG